MESKKNKNTIRTTKLIDTENRLVVARGNRWGWCVKWVKGIEYKIMSWDVMYSMMTIVLSFLYI